MTLEIAAGSVFHLYCGFCAQPKWKFFVVAYTAPRLRFFVINSAPAAFQRENDALMAHQVPLLASEHAFLKRDSVLSCGEVLGGYSASDLEDKFAGGERVLIGTISESARKRVLQLVAESTLLSKVDIDSIRNEWSKDQAAKSSAA